MPSSLGSLCAQVIQFGYIAMFSASFPLGAIAATAMNIVELRVDAYKFMFSTRRASYEGSDDIGSWRRVIQVVSWISIIINVLIIAYASNGVRDSVVVPFVAKLDTCEAATSDELLSVRARHFGLQTSWNSPCVQNYRDCFADIGAVSWLPARKYLDPREDSSQSYMNYGLCNEGSTLYNPEHCTACQHRSTEVYLALAWFVIIVEHLLLLFKLGILFVLPNKPAWVREKEAREKHEIEEKERLRMRHIELAT